MSRGTALVPLEDIARRIHTVRGQRVMLDSDLAALYGVTTGRLNEQVKRNRHRFPPDFMFRLTREQVTNLISQFAISSLRHGGRHKLPNVFTEHGAGPFESQSVTSKPAGCALDFDRAPEVAA